MWLTFQWCLVMVIDYQKQCSTSTMPRYCLRYSLIMAPSVISLDLQYRKSAASMLSVNDSPHIFKPMLALHPNRRSPSCYRLVP